MRSLAVLLLALAAGLPVLGQDATRAARAPRLGPVEVQWKAPEPLRTLLAGYLPPPEIEPGERRFGMLRPWMREVRRRVPEILGAEGYFSPEVDIAFEGEDRGRVVVSVVPGPRTRVGEVEIGFRGDLALPGEAREQRRRQLREWWTLKAGAWFRSADWEAAKTRLAEDLVAEDYAAGVLAESRATVDAASAQAKLTLVVDSGPPFTFGEVRVEGLEHYSEALVRRLVDLGPGERYSSERLAALQHRVQEGPWFSTVTAEVARDREHPDLAPVTLTVSERPRREVGASVGYGTDEGARAELAYRHRDLFDRGFDLQSSMRTSQEHSIGYADVFLPPGLYDAGARGRVPFRDSFGVLAERSDVQNLLVKRVAVAGYRRFKLDGFEIQFGLAYQVERSRPLGGDEGLKRALAPIVAATWRRVDDIYDPRRGGVLNMQVAAGSRALASGDDFLKLYAQYQHWVPLGPNDQLLLRAEVGRTHTAGRESIPEDFFFRAGGARSNRGYAYQSLGVRQGEAIVGGRYLATGTAEYVHWLDDKWGAAAFVDVGDAKDSTRDWKANQSYGVGARLRTPAGPFAIDLAYADGTRKFRLAFSVTVAF